MRENHVHAWVVVVGSVMKNSFQSSMKLPHPAKCVESKAAVRGRKVTGPAVYKNIAEFNEICTAHREGGCTKGSRLTMKQNRGERAVSHGVSACCYPTGGLSANPVHRVGEEKLREESR